MRKYIICFFLIPMFAIDAQWDFSVSMGLDFKSTSSFRDYINSGFAPANDKLSTFSSSVNFNAEAGYQFTETFQLALEYSLSIDSYNTSVAPGGVYEISYNSHRPSLIGYYVVKGDGYKFKFGGGIGPRFISLEEKIILSTDYTTNGFGVLLKADGNTLLGGDFYALIGFDIRYDMPGELKSDDGTYIQNYGNGERVNLNALSFGIKLGIAYLL
ncbi:MAG: hypothetical protein AB1521_13790 [Bacteroidota bacterium]